MTLCNRVTKRFCGERGVSRREVVQVDMDELLEKFISQYEINALSEKDSRKMMKDLRKFIINMGGDPESVEGQELMNRFREYYGKIDLVRSGVMECSKNENIEYFFSNHERAINFKRQVFEVRADFDDIMI